MGKATRTERDTTPPAFSQWFASPRNPMHGSTNTVLYFAKDALRAAFEAGATRYKYEREQAKANARGDDIENPFDE